MSVSINVRNLQVGDLVKLPNGIATSWQRVVGIEVTDVYTVLTENPDETFHVVKTGTRSRVTVKRPAVPGLAVLREAQPWEGVGWVVETRGPATTPYSERFTVRAQADTAYNGLALEPQHFESVPVYGVLK